MSLKKGWDIDSPYAFDRQALNFIKRWWIDIDKINLLLIISIITFGLVMTTTASPYVAKKIDAGNLFFVKKQIIFSLIAIFILLTFSLFNKDQIKIISILGIIGVVGLLVMVALFGSEAKGAKRWITLFGFTLQPSEFAKTFFVIFNAFLLQKLKNKEWFIKYGASMFFYLLIIALLISQPDFGMSLVFSLLWVVQLFLF
ncbi:MAG: FtsW/RodA/SpoVE family cell cycle protein, partial [Proteobacteria bacterium]|nr:FtsW/RodA/SpoVE family cell cycle protein [Pseudomonadota bacterium]